MTATASFHEENTLLQKVASGDEYAFKALFTQYRRKVFFFARKILKSDSLAEDALQEIFLKIWLNREKLPEVASFNAYLNTATYHHIYNVLRKQANEAGLLHKLINRQEDVPKAATVIDQLSAQELMRSLHQAMSALTPQQKKVFELSRIEGMKHEEIAQALNISRETVKKHIVAALHVIRQRMHNYEKLVQLGILIFFTRL